VERQRKHKLLAFVRNAAAILLVTGMLFVITEGVASTFFVADQVQFGAMAERLYTQFDPELGWVGKPNVYLKDVYGPRIYLRTDSRGFRSSQEFTARVPAGKWRVICSGDSFTLGYGVDNEHTWCRLLEAADPRLETVNMGQGGYGLDQAYLWYKRDGERLEHNLHIMAVIGDDFRRMESSDFIGYAKPTLAVRGGRLVVEHVPVPRSPEFKPWLRRNSGAISQLRSVWLLGCLGRRFEPEWKGLRSVPGTPAPGERQVAGKILESLQASNARGHSGFVFVYLPAEQDIYNPGYRAEWRAFLRERARAGLPFIDLTDDFLNLPFSRMNAMFIHDAAQGLAIGHYTPAGNEFVAERLGGRLRAMGLLPARP
jgi:hypothetical protein